MKLLHKIALLLSLLGMAWSAALIAQPADTEPDTPPATEQQAEDTTPAEEAEESPPPEPEDPFDYEASEKISEDRSVSFPVDI